MVEIVILAGGGGTRLWPASRRDRPKQFLKIPDGKTTLLQTTLNRAKALADLDHIWIVTLAEQVQETQSQLPHFDRSHIFAEPVGKNSGPAACAITLYLEALRGEPTTILMFSADHLIPLTGRFLQTMKKGLARAAHGESLVGFGLKVKEARTDYGYLQAEGRGKSGVRRVKRFVEKPRLAVARKMAQSKDYFWNSGMFAWRSDLFAREMARHAPDLYAPLAKVDWRSVDLERHLAPIYRKFDGRSIDYALMEKSKRVEVVPSSFVWSDVGNWDAVHVAHGKGNRANAIMGPGKVLEGTGNLVHTETKPVYLFGVCDLVVVETDDATMITTRKGARDLKKFLERLR